MCLKNLIFTDVKITMYILHRQKLGRTDFFYFCGNPLQKIGFFSALIGLNFLCKICINYIHNNVKSNAPLHQRLTG